MQLRTYQKRIIEDARGYLRAGEKDILIQSPTGSGKTILTAFMLRESAARGKKSWFTVHRRELIDQTCTTFSTLGIPFNLCVSGKEWRHEHPITIASIQTLSRRLARAPRPDMVIFDEAHHCAASSWSRVHGAFPGSTRIGLTATPRRLDGKGLAGWFGRMVVGPTVKELTNSGYLSPYKLYAPQSPDLSGIPTRMGDYHREALSERMGRPSVTGCALSEYQDKASGKQFIAFCVSVTHSERTAQVFNEAGIRCAHLDGATPAARRREIIEQFRAKKIRGICNCDLFGEGLDVPGIEAAILLRPTQSLPLYLQQVGRALRPTGDTAIILDHAGNCIKHGLPDDEHEWTLEDAPKKKRGERQEIFVKICDSCLAAQKPGGKSCVYCAEPFKANPREIRTVAGTLNEVIALERKTRRRMQGRAQTMQELIELGRQRGYKNPQGWAYYVHRSRKARA